MLVVILTPSMPLHVWWGTLLPLNCPPFGAKCLLKLRSFGAKCLSKLRSELQVVVVLDDNFSYFSLKPYVVTPYLNRLIETIQMRQDGSDEGS